MKVLIYATGQDTGGQGYRMAEAFGRHAPDWQVWARNASPSVLGYPEQHPLPMLERKAEINARYGEANVVHLRNNLTGWQFMDKGRGKPIVVHHHGSQFRDNHGRIAAEARRIHAVQLAATLDLTLLEPDVTWCPSPYNVDALAKMRKPKDDGVIRIAYFPTSARIKSAGPFLAAYTEIAKSHNVELISNLRASKVIHKPWPEVMRAKGKADIYFDQVILGYGNNAIEAWAMGIPVIAGVEDPKVRRLMLETFGELPFVEATEDTIGAVLLRLVESAEMRAEYGALGYAHVRRFHDEARVVDLLKDVYEDVPPSRTINFETCSPRAWAKRRATMRERQTRLLEQRHARSLMRQ